MHELAQLILDYEARHRNQEIITQSLQMKTNPGYYQDNGRSWVDGLSTSAAVSLSAPPEVFINFRENAGELGGDGGSFGINRFQDSYPQTSNELEPWLIGLKEKADKVNTQASHFTIEDQEDGSLIASGTVLDNKFVSWN